MQFTKMHGLGNDYVYINGFKETVSDPARLAIQIANRHTGVGGDGLILILPPDNPTSADLRMQMFNNDGSESEMCGNGIRCVAKYAADHNLTTANPMRVQTGAGILTINYTTNVAGLLENATVDMGEPILQASLIPTNIPNLAPDAHIIDHPFDSSIPNIPDPRMTCVSMGNPHVTFYCDDVAAIDLNTLGPLIEIHPYFPNRINVHFIQIHSPTELTMRTWERGTGITQACGTGASAVAVSGVLTGRNSRNVLAHLPGGDLQLEWREADNHLYMTGPATEVFTGTWPH